MEHFLKFSDKVPFSKFIMFKLRIHKRCTWPKNCINYENLQALSLEDRQNKLNSESLLLWDVCQTKSRMKLRATLDVILEKLKVDTR